MLRHRGFSMPEKEITMTIREFLNKMAKMQFNKTFDDLDEAEHDELLDKTGIVAVSVSREDMEILTASGFEL